MTYKIATKLFVSLALLGLLLTVNLARGEDDYDEEPQDDDSYQEQSHETGDNMRWTERQYDDGRQRSCSTIKVGDQEFTTCD